VPVQHLVAALAASLIVAGVERCRRQDAATAGDWLVVTVNDGDTVTAKAPDGGNRRIRLVGIDAPEYDQPFGREARDALAAQVGGRQIAVESHGLDQHGRVLGLLRVEGVDVNTRLVSQGYAWVFNRVAPDPGLVAAESAARRERRGLWAADNPIEPSSWRARHPRQP
jgi:endonuclease YncB( thermonuclease family)